MPRWEWRTFDTEFDDAGRRLSAFDADRVQASDEVYLLSTHSDASVKFRDDVVDVKHLERVSDDGLELWVPVMKETFPLGADDVASVLTTLGIGVPASTRSEYTREDFARELVAPEPKLLALEVHKHRVHYLVDGCMVELTDVATEHGAVRTLAIESPDPGAVRTTLARLGLDGRRNVNVARGLKTLVGMGGRRYGVIDVGTNSVKFLMGEVQADGSMRTIVDRADITRLGEALDRLGRLSDEAIERTTAAIAAMVEEAQRGGAEEVIAVGTAGLRVAHNRAAFDESLTARCGATVDVLSGEEEGRLAYVAATSALPVAGDRLLVFDSGGGSTQFTFGQAGRVDERFSLDVGAVRIAERCDLVESVSRDVVDAALEIISEQLQPLHGRTAPDSVVAMGGTVTNLAAVNHGLSPYDPEVVHGTVLDLAEIDRQVELYRTLGIDGRRRIPGLQPDRADVILAGACIVRAILTELGHDALTVTDRGLRHGLFAERFVR